LSSEKRPLIAGASAALFAALSFGATAPLVARAGAHVGPLTTAASLYAGAAMSSLLRFEQRASGARFEKRHVGRLLLIALVGAGVAPTLLAWGLQRTGGTIGSLLLNLEAVFTVLLAWLVYREPIGKRVAAALVLMTGGGVALTLGVALTPGWSLLGAAAVAAATLAWGVDNTLSRGLSQQDPVSTVALKGALGAALTALAAYAVGEPLPSRGAAVILIACGATGYGLSLRLYLTAQRRMGAARTSSIFAVAPFVGAALGFALGDRPQPIGLLISCMFFGAGLWLHLTEHHEHRHLHDAIDHEHPHRHDDGHHDHAHEPPVHGEHSHPHHHDRVEHDHEHAPDVHHDHRH
jgi:drug/metabolite transporter (DMT)-like permease